MFPPLPSSPNLASATPKKCVPSRFFSSVSHVHPLTEAPQDCREHCSDFISSLCARKWKNNRRMKKKKKKRAPEWEQVLFFCTSTRLLLKRDLFLGEASSSCRTSAHWEELTCLWRKRRQLQNSCVDRVIAPQPSMHRADGG